ncbi:DUF1656 domain-containing protein [Ancylobacter sp. 6x-1]|uniref:DUF1656 domain-containing protein n=1 Tax=Ancylobacter crimeensis TaxID=2579147 RepID=A0ABT0DCJ5_9HYPH|nr:DUF1656 domain-containing protein [Ancylobacter crimeensis]MCK0197688.1 DUF1656 domain-containing protein [Ancylobacter crimeensis]
MTAEIDIYGVYVPTLLALMVLALPLSVVVRRLLAWCGVYSFVWHRGLFDVALYVILLGVLSSTSHWWLP